MDDDKLTIGFIIAVHGGQAMIALSQFHHQFGSGSGESTSDERARIGSLLKVRSRDATVYGVVTRLATDVEPGPEGPVERNIADIDLLGEVMDSSGDNPVFERGVSVMPNLGAEVVATSHDDIAVVYAQPTSHNVSVIKTNGTVERVS